MVRFANLNYPEFNKKIQYKSIRNLAYPFLTWMLFLTIIVLNRDSHLNSENIFRGTINTVCFFFIYYISEYIGLVYYEKKQYSKWLFVLVGSLIVMSLFRSWFEFKKIGTPIYKWSSVMPVPIENILLMTLFFMAIGMIPFFLGTFSYLRKSKMNLETAYLQMQVKHLESELSMLKNQLSPHFLFNTLNNIYSAAVLDNKKTPEMILKLSSLFRYVIYTIRDEKVSIASEVEQIENYLHLFQSRFPEKLSIEFEKETKELFNLPPMLLLTIVENALKHSNLDGENLNAFLAIKMRSGDSKLYFEVTNSYLQSERTDNNNGIGIKNLEDRLAIEYPDKHKLDIQKTNSIFKVNLEIDYSH